MLQTQIFRFVAEIVNGGLCCFLFPFLASATMTTWRDARKAETDIRENYEIMKL